MPHEVYLTPHKHSLIEYLLARTISEDELILLRKNKKSIKKVMLRNLNREILLDQLFYEQSAKFSTISSAQQK